ncbi:MAG: c-type cytochrome biogenesis protein CcmI [Rubrivivax sp.]|nr:c-type cytochrome biogenesis protein CcmI [Rubrivivax sp.]
MNEAIATLRQQLQQLKSLHDSGTLDKKAYEAAKAPLERKLLEQVMKDPGSAKDLPAEAPRPSWNLVGLLSVVVVIVAGGGYLWTGSPGLPSAGAPGSQTEAAAQGDPHTMDEKQFADAVEKMAERLKSEPDNAEGWAILARSYARMGRFAEAVPTYEKALALAPDDPRLLADYADTVAMKNDRNLEGEPTKLVERALKIDPDNAKALALAGTAAFNRKDYTTAVRHWERLAKVAPPDATFLPQLQSSVDEARSLGGMPPGPRLVPTGAPAAPAAAATPPKAEQAAGTAPAAPSAATVTGTVRLSPALLKQAAPDDAVFIYARAAEGSRMPLAILRHQVKDLPLNFKLDDNMAMSPAAKMSLFPKLIISARISKSGQAAPAAGDLTGESSPVDKNANGVVIEIKDVVGK